MSENLKPVTQQALSPEQKEKLSKLSLPFIENKGQYPEDVRFYAKTFGGSVFVTKDGEIIYTLPEGKDRQEPEGKRQSQKDLSTITNPSPPNKGVALKERLIGADAKAVKGEEPSEAKVSYFKGNDPSKWQTGLGTYSMVSLGEVYKGIELKLKAYGKNVEKLFYVKPEATPDKIRVKVEGGEELKIAESGELIVKTSLGDVRVHKAHSLSGVEWKEEVYRGCLRKAFKRRIRI